jgi:hypothetical protein
MKRNLVLPVLLFSIHVSICAQQRKEISHYLFPEFTEGVVLMKNGVKNPALLNYNAATEEMIFKQGDQVLALAEPTLNQLDTVFIGDRVFILYERKFVEILHRDGFNLFAQNKCRVIPPGKPAAYGGTSQTSSTDSYSGWVSGGRLYELKLPDDYQVKPYTIYLLDNGSGWKSIKSMRQLSNIYKKERALYKKYTDENSVDFEDQKAVAQLIHFMETH